MTETPVTDLRDAIEEMEIAYEFLISFAGEGIDRTTGENTSEQVNEYVANFETALGDGYDAATAVPTRHDQFDTAAYTDFIDEMEAEIDEAQTVLTLIGEQEIVTSPMADNINGMSVFQSVMMKFFFLDELTTHLERDQE